MVFHGPHKGEQSDNQVSASGDTVETKTEEEKVQSRPDGEIKEGESTLVCRVLSGEEEQKLWERILEQRDKRQMNRKGRHGFGGHVSRYAVCNRIRSQSFVLLVLSLN